MNKGNDKEFWKQEIKYFIVEHPTFKGSEEEIFTPRENLKIRFWIEGNLHIKGSYLDLEINFNSSKLLVLSKRRQSSSQSNIFRIPWSRIISVELVTNKDTDDELRKLIRFTPEQNN